MQCSIEETGEHIIAGAGELHLEICLKDLQVLLLPVGELFTCGTPCTTCFVGLCMVHPGKNNAGIQAKRRLWLRNIVQVEMMII